MKSDEMKSIIRNTPVSYALFRVTKVPSWAVGEIRKGDLIAAEHESTFLYVSENDRIERIALSSSYLQFVGYAETTSAQSLRKILIDQGV